MSTAGGGGSSPYGVTLPNLVKLTQERSEHGIEGLQNLNGTKGLAEALKSDLKNGISGAESDISSRHTWFGRNALEVTKPKGFWELAYEAVQDPTLLILISSGAVATILEMIFNEEHRSTAWIEGFAIFCTVVAVTLITALTDLQKEKQFRDLQAKNDEQNVCTLYRGGKKVEEIPFEEVVVGDVMEVREGLVLPADGILIDGMDIECDEAALTGEAEAIHKNLTKDPFILSGTSISRGQGIILVTGVGLFSEEGIIQSLVTGAGEDEKQRLLGLYKNDIGSVDKAGGEAAARQAALDDVAAEEQANRQQKSSGKKTSVLTAKLDKLAIQIGWLALLAGILCFVGLVIRFTVISHVSHRCTENCPEDYENSLGQSEEGPCLYSLGVTDANGTFISTGQYACYDYIDDSCATPRLVPATGGLFLEECGIGWDHGTDWRAMVKFFIVGVTVLVVAIPEGLPLAVTISLAYSVKKMMSVDSNLVRVLASCETMGNASCICSDKTGTLTLNRMTVVRALMADKSLDVKGKPEEISGVPEIVRAAFAEGAAVNSSDNTRYHVDKNKNWVDEGFEADESGAPIQFGNKTECGILEFADKMGLLKYYQYREEKNELNGGVAKQFNFDHIKKRMTTVVKSDNNYRVYVKGASEIVLELCTQYLGADGTAKPLTPEVKASIEKSIRSMADEALRTLLLTYRDVDSSTSIDDDNELCRDLILIGLVGIQDPERPEVPDAVLQCKRAGVSVRMVTGDNKFTARAIAINVNIIEKDAPDDACMTGPEFRHRILDEFGEIDYVEFAKIWPNLKVIARCSPTDKYNFVKGLIHFGQVVAVTGDGTNDAPALSMADVGFAMGSGTLVAQKASDIVIMNDNFASIVKAISWGRNVYDCIAKFLVFQLTVNVVAVTFTFISSLAVGQSPFTATQMLWVNVIMDTLAALALATEPPSKGLLKRKPYARDAPLLNKLMAKQIFGHAFYQLLVCFVILYAGPSIMDIDDDKDKSATSGEAGQHFTLLFNAFVWMQLFNEVNARRIDGKKNVFKGWLNNTKFLTVMIIQIIGQILIIEVFPYISEKIFMTTPLTITQWGVSMLLGFGEWPWNFFLLSCVPESIVPDAIINLFKIKLDKGEDSVAEAKDEEEAVGLKQTKAATIPLASSTTFGGSTEQIAENLAAKQGTGSQSGLRGWGRLRSQLQVVSAFQTLAQTSKTMRSMKERAHRMSAGNILVEDENIKPAQALWKASLNIVRKQIQVVDAMKSFQSSDKLEPMQEESSGAAPATENYLDVAEPAAAAAGSPDLENSKAATARTSEV